MIPHATEQLSLCDTTLHFCQSIFLFLAFPLFKLIFIGVQLIYTVVLVSAVQQSESIIHIHISTLFQILFPYISLHSIEQSSLCYTVRSYQLSILYIVVLYMSIPISQFIPPSIPFKSFLEFPSLCLRYPSVLACCPLFPSEPLS